MKTAQDFPVDTQVVSRANKERKGVVIANKLRNSNQVAVDWEDGRLERVNVYNLMNAEDLENEFEKTQEAINEKIRNAAQLIDEANALAVAEGKNLQSIDYVNYDHLFEVGALERAMGNAGWNPSSWYC